MKQTKMINLILATLVSTAFLACPKKGDSNQAPLGYNGYQNCTNCGGMINGQELLITDSTEFNNMFTLQLGFSGVQNNNGYNNGYTYGYNLSQYQGAIAASRGMMTIMQGLYQGNCLIPAGSYSIGTLTAGQYQNGIIQGLVLIANGPANLIINMAAAQIASPNNRDQYGMLLPNQRLFSTNMAIESVNGQYCQMPVTIR